MHGVLEFERGDVMTVRLDYYFSSTYSLPPLLLLHCTTDTLPSLLVIAFSWTYLPIPRLGQDASRTVCSPPIYYRLYPCLYCTTYAHINPC